MMGDANDQRYSGLTEVQLIEGEYVFTPNSIQYPEFLPSGSSTIAVSSNHEANQLLLIANDENEPLSLIYDYTDGAWIELESDVLSLNGVWGDLAISSERNEAIYFNSLDTNFFGENATYIFDFDTLRWSAITGSIIPDSLVEYNIIYHSAIDQYILLGGFDAGSPFPNNPNNDVWLFNPRTRKWNMIVEELPILSNIIAPKFYYDTHEEKIVGFGESVSDNNVYWLFYIKIEELSAVIVDFGIPIPTLLAGVGFLVIILSTIGLRYVIVKRRSSITQD